MSNGVRVATPAPGCARIVLDTNAARNLGESEGLPPYLDVLIEMTAAGHVVHLADGAWAELLAQRHRGSLGDVVFERMMTRLVPLLSTEVPVFLSGNDLRGYLGEDMGEPAWTESEFVGTSQRAMALLRAATVLSPNAQLPEGHRAAEEVLQEVRDAWIAHFDRMLEELPPTAEDDELGGPTFEAFCRRVDDESDLPHPPMSKRMDLGIRYAWRQHVRKNRERGAYNPASPKKLNDGIDFDLYYFLMLPALLVTDDAGFGAKLDPIESFQRSWIYATARLTQAWRSGTIAAATWPA